MFTMYERMCWWASRSDRNLFIVSALWFTFFLLLGLVVMVLMFNYCMGLECSNVPQYEQPLIPQG